MKKIIFFLLAAHLFGRICNPPAVSIRIFNPQILNI